MTDSIEDIPESIDLVDGSQYDGTTFAIGRGYNLNLKYYEDQLRLMVFSEDGDGNRYVNNNLNRGFFESDQKIRTYGNDISRDTGINDPPWIKSRLRDVRQFVEAAELESLPDDGRDLLDRTQEVQCYQSAESLKVVIWLESPDESPISGVRRMHFDGVDEWRTDSAELVRNKHYQIFLTDLAIADRDWNEIWKRWEDEMTLEQSERQGEEDIIADRVIDVLKNRVAGQVYDFADPVPNSAWNAYYERESDLDGIDSDEPVVWIQTRALQQILEDETQKSPSKYIGTLSGTLAERDVKLAGSRRRHFAGERIRVHPLYASELDVDEDTVLTEEDLEQSPEDDSDSESVETKSPGNGVIEP